MCRSVSGADRCEYTTETPLPRERAVCLWLKETMPLAAAAAADDDDSRVKLESARQLTQQHTQETDSRLRVFN